MAVCGLFCITFVTEGDQISMLIIKRPANWYIFTGCVLLEYLENFECWHDLSHPFEDGALPLPLPDGLPVLLGKFATGVPDERDPPVLFPPGLPPFPPPFEPERPPLPLPPFDMIEIQFLSCMN
jgi:hypothetical protein